MKAFRGALFVAFVVTFCAVGRVQGMPASEQATLYEAFEELMRTRDYSGARDHLEEWKAKSPADAQLAVAKANFYFLQAEQLIELRRLNESESSESLVSEKDVVMLYDAETSKAAGVIDFTPRYDDELLTRAVTVLSEAATSFPERLDISYGVAHMLLITEDYDRTFEVLRESTRFASRNPEKLRWLLDGPLPDDPARFVPKSLHGYTKKAAEAETPEGDKLMLRIAELAAEYYPRHPYAYNDLAIYYDIRKDSAKALEYLLKAHGIDPDDALVTMNIAGAYLRGKDREKAKEFYRKTVALAKDEDLKAEAEAALKELD